MDMAEIDNFYNRYCHDTWPLQDEERKPGNKIGKMSRLFRRCVCLQWEKDNKKIGVLSADFASIFKINVSIDHTTNAIPRKDATVERSQKSFWTLQFTPKKWWCVAKIYLTIITNSKNQKKNRYTNGMPAIANLRRGGKN